MKIRKDRLFILCSFIFLGLLFLIYSFRFTYFFIKEKISKDIKSIPFNEYLMKENKSFRNGKDYIFTGKNVNNYVYYNGIMYRIVSIKDKKIKLITNESITTMYYGNTSFTESYVNDWLNGKENSGVFLKSLNGPERYLIKTKTCVDNVTNIDTTTCEKYDENYLIGLLSISEYNEAGGKESFLNNGTNYYLSNNTYVSSNGNILSDKDNGYGVRPTITLNESIILLSGDGSYDNPYVFSKNESKILVNKDIGSYVTYNNALWRIVSKTESGVKVAMDGYVLNNKEPEVISFSKVSNIYNTNSMIGGYLNKTFYKYLENQDYLVDGKWYYGEYIDDYKDVYKKYTTSKLGLLTIGDMFLSDVDDVFTSASSKKNMIFTITKKGMLNTEKMNSELKIRPSLYLDSTLNVTGEGTKNDPLKLSREVKDEI